MGHLSTTPNGMWVLQALTGVESMPVPLRLRPFVAAADADRMVATDLGPVAIEHTAEYASLVAAGVIDVASGAVEDTIVDWMTVIARAQRHINLSIRQPSPDASDDAVLERHLVVVQQDQWLVMVARYGDEVILSGIGDSSDPAAQLALICDVLIHAVGVSRPAAIDGVNITTSALQDTLRATYESDRTTMAYGLGALGLTPDQVDVVIAAAHPGQSAMAVVTVVAFGASIDVHPETVTVVDTEHGRVSVSYATGSDGVQWTSIWPGTEAVLRADLTRLIGTPTLV